MSFLSTKGDEIKLFDAFFTNENRKKFIFINNSYVYHY